MLIKFNVKRVIVRKESVKTVNNVSGKKISLKNVLSNKKCIEKFR